MAPEFYALYAKTRKPTEWARPGGENLARYNVRERFPMAENRPSLIGHTPEALAQIATKLGFPARCGRQLAHHLYARATSDISAMLDLPKEFRAKISEAYDVSPLQVASHKKSTDGVEKLLVHRGDNQVVECVLLPYEERQSCCLSTQVGCPMACTFCATGMGGFDRNLEVGEIIGQYLMLQGLTPRRIGHVVFMGMGEPLLNMNNVLRTIDLLHGQVGLSMRHITISTVGLVPQIRALAEKKLPIHLALSLHSPIDEIRARLMPVNHRWGVREVMGAMRDYQKATGRKITIEYLLIDQINDTREQAIALAQLMRGVPHVVNLIPFNWVDTERGYQRPSRARIDAFKRELTSRGCNATERIERGHDIAAACGQLAGQHAGRFGKRKMTAIETRP